MRIAMIGAKGISTSLSGGGGVERHVEQLSKKLAEKGHHVTVYVRSYTHTEKTRMIDGVHVVTLPTILNKYFATIIHVFLASIHVLFRRADIIHYHAVGSSLLSWIPRLFKPRARIVVTFHSRDRFHEKWNWFGRFFLALGEWTACTIPHLTIAVSHGIQLFCRHMFGRRVVYIPNGIDLPTHEPGTAILRALDVKPGEYMITLGRLIPLKAHDEAIRAFRDIRTTKQLLIIGAAAYEDPGYYAKLEKLAKEDSRVRLLGFRSGEELHQLIAHCYCMIHPSRVEGLSLAILEAMSYGRLVIMSDIPANRELVDHSGISFPVGNVKALCETLEWVLSDPVLMRVRGERARAVVRRLYSWEHIVKRTEEEYRRLTNNH